MESFRIESKAIDDQRRKEGQGKAVDKSKPLKFAFGILKTVNIARPIDS